MTRQVLGHYNSSRDKLLKNFDDTAALMNSSVQARYGEEFTRTLQKAVQEEYERLIPEIPYIHGLRAKPFNAFLLITAQELAVYKAMKKNGKSPAEAWELCHEALRLSLAQIPRWNRWLWRHWMFSSLVKRIFSRRAKRQERGRFGDFEVEYLGGQGGNFDLGVNYLQCANLCFAAKHGGEEFAPYICMSDIALSDALGWGLTRTQTLADGCQFCDFRFTEGEATRISSRTPEVQHTIERIRARESQEGANLAG